MVMRIRKYHPHKSVLFVTFSVEEGLLFLANPLCLAIVRSCLAGAQTLYPVTISHFIVQATHLHMFMVVNNPEDINKVLGRDKRTIWCEGYDSPIVLTLEKAQSIIAYLYTNPVKDGLIESIDSFPGLSSWKMFLKGEGTKKWKRLRRPAVRALQNHSLRTYTQESKRLLQESNTTHEFRIEPNAWQVAFGITDPKEQEARNRELVRSIRELEKTALEERQSSKTKVMGRERLISRPIDISYRPKRFGRRMCCLSEDRSLRVRFIGILKELYAKAKEVSERWRQGDFSLPFPPGLYPPSFPKLVEPLTAW